jgi:hypothetical protein
MEIESQNKKIRHYLESGRKLTRLDALYMFGTINLPGRIFDIKKQGLDIDDIWIDITSPSVYNGKKHIKLYFKKK